MFLADVKNVISTMEGGQKESHVWDDIKKCKTENYTGDVCKEKETFC